MQHIALFVYILFLSTGFGGITVTSILYHRTREKLLIPVLMVVGFFSLGLIVHLALYYVQEIIIYPLDAGPIERSVNFVLTVLMDASILILVRRSAPHRSPVPIMLLFLTAAGVFLVFGILGTSFRFVVSLVEENRHLVSLISVTVSAAFLGYAGWTFRGGSEQKMVPSIALLIRRLGFMLMGYSVVSFAAGILSSVGSIRADIQGALNYLLFLIWNGVAIAAFVTHLSRPADPFSSETLSEETLSKYGISPREAEVIRLIARGYANKEIADELGVSFTTVRTHIYNVFRKTGARSRVDLLRILSQ